MEHIFLGNSAFDTAQETFLPVDTDNEKKSLKKDGTANGQVNAPPAQATQLDAIEQEVVQQIAQTAQLTHGALNNHFVVFHTRLLGIIKTLNPQAMIDKIESIPSKMKTELDNKINAFEAASAIKEPAWRNAQKEYEAFRKEKKVIRPPDYLPRMHMILWFALFIITEATLNATLLWELTGILTALGQTALITAVNVLLGAAGFGLSLRYKNYPPPISRWPILPCTIVVLGILTFNFGVGHYRDALVDYKEQAEQQQTELNWDEIAEDIDLVDYTKIAMASMWAAPLDIKSMLSFLLIIVGLGFFCFATQKWYSMFDPLPGYRKREQALKKAHADYTKLANTTRDKINSIIEVAKDEVEDEHTKVINMREQHRDLIDHAEALQGAYSKWILVLEKTQNQLLAEYRDANEKARDKPVPNYYFNSKLPIDPELTKAPKFQPSGLHATEEVVNEVSKILKKIQGIADAAWRRLDSWADMQLGTDAGTLEQ